MKKKFVVNLPLVVEAESEVAVRLLVAFEILPFSWIVELGDFKVEERV